MEETTPRLGLLVQLDLEAAHYRCVASMHAQFVLLESYWSGYYGFIIFRLIADLFLDLQMTRKCIYSSQETGNNFLCKPEIDNKFN